MKTFEELYQAVLERKITLKEPLPSEYDPRHLDCLLHPKRYAPVVQEKECRECAFDRACLRSCIFDAIEIDGDGKARINPSLCTGCGVCIDACEEKRLSAGRDVLPAMKAVREAEGPAYMMVAPAFLGQFGDGISPGGWLLRRWDSPEWWKLPCLRTY